MVVAEFIPAGPLLGEVRVPGDKSVSHRALILAALADGESLVRGLGSGADVASSAACLRYLGVEVETTRNGEVVVRPPRGGLRPPSATLDAGNSGTTMRLLAGVLAGQPFRSRLDGDVSLRRRPMRRVTEPLRWMGAEVFSERAGPDGGEETAPLVIRGPVPPRPLAARAHTLSVASAQVKSCLLLAGLHAAGMTSVAEPFPSRDHTERMLRLFGARVRSLPGAGAAVESEGRPNLHPAEVDIPGDFSSAAFWIAVGLLVPGSELRLPGVGVNPTRTGLLQVLSRMGAGAHVVLENLREAADGGEPTADITVRALEPSRGTGPGRGGAAGGLTATRVSADEIPRLIDEIPVLAVVATQAEGRTVIEGAGELRVKESDRLAALCSQLARLGARVQADGDALIIEGPTPLRPADVDSGGDHRLALALAVAALAARSAGGRRPARSTRVAGFEAAGISYPEFRRHLEALSR